MNIQYRSRRGPGRPSADDPPASPTVKKHLDLLADVVEKVQQKARERNLSFTEMMNQALDEWLAQQ